jgi:hypothetical protein
MYVAPASLFLGSLTVFSVVDLLGRVQDLVAVLQGMLNGESTEWSLTLYKVTENTINWLSTGFLFAFVVASP